MNSVFFLAHQLWKLIWLLYCKSTLSTLVQFYYTNQPNKSNDSSNPSCSCAYSSSATRTSQTWRLLRIRYTKVRRVGNLLKKPINISHNGQSGYHIKPKVKPKKVVISYKWSHQDFACKDYKTGHHELVKEVVWGFCSKAIPDVVTEQRIQRNKHQRKHVGRVIQNRVYSFLNMIKQDMTLLRLFLLATWAFKTSSLDIWG